MTDIAATSGKKPFRLGTWRVEPALNEISMETVSVRLEPKLMRLLVLLAFRRGQPVTKDEIIEEVWDGLAVTDDVLSQAVSKLRRALGDDRKTPKYIETVWKSGYRCIATASSLDDGEVSNIGPKSRGGGIQAIMLLTVFLGIAVAIVWGYLSIRVIEPATGFAAGEFRTITSFPGREADPALSPDGTRVAYSRPSREGQSSGIFVTPVSGAGTIQLTDGPTRDESPVWSPDGANIAFFRRQSGNCMIMEIPAIGGATSALADCHGNVYADLAWSPDGRYLALGGRERPGDPVAILLIDLEADEGRAVTSPPTGIWGDFDPVFSPDGRQLAFIRSWSEASQDIFVVLVADGLERQLTDDRRNVFGLAWLADEDAVLAASNRRDNYDLWKIPLNGSPGIVLGGVGNPVNPALAGDGKTLVFEARNNDVNIWRVPLATDGISAAAPDSAPIIASTKWDGHPSLSPDGTQVAYVSDRTGAFEVWLAVVGEDAGRGSVSEAKLTDLGANFVGTPQWSADGRALVFDARLAGNSRIFVMDILDRQPRPMTDGRSNALNPSWRTGDGALLYASDRDGGWSLWSRDFRSGNEDRVVEGGFFGFEDARSGEIYYAKFAEPGLRRLLPSGEGEMIIPMLDEGDWGSWQLDRDGIVFIERTSGGRARISKYMFADGSLRPLATLPGFVPRRDGALALFPGGRGALVTQLDSQESDLVVVSSVAGH